MIFAPRKLACLLFLLVVLCADACAAACQAQALADPVNDGDVIRINTNVVQVDATVVDKNGKNRG